MNVFDNPYFRLNKKLLCILGLWPYNSQRKFIQIGFVTFILILTVPQMSAAIVNISDIDKEMEYVFNLLIVAQVLLKYVTLAVAVNKIKSVYNDITNIWVTIIDAEEKRILLRYSNRARILTKIYLSLVSITATAFFAMPLVPEMLNVIDPLPVPRAHLFTLNGEYLVDRDDHFFKIYMWETISVFSVIIIFMGVDSMYMVTVEQSTALYAIITYRLSKLRGRLLTDRQEATDDTYEWLTYIIKLHQMVLSFTSNINDSYSTCFFCLSMLNIVFIPLTCVLVLVYWHNFIIMIRYVFAIISVLIHMFVLFWPSQKLIDHSTKLLDDAYCNDWYVTSAKTKKLLRIFMLRCSEPQMITAGGLVEMNFEVYSQIVKTAASYSTVLASFR